MAPSIAAIPGTPYPRRASGPALGPRIALAMIFLAVLSASARADDLGAMRSKARGLSDGGQYGLSLPAWEAVLAKTQPAKGEPPSPVFVDALIESGISASMTNRYDVAHQYLDRAVELSPNNARALLNLGLLCLHEKKSDHAEDLFRRAIAADPTLLDAHLHLGMIAEERGDLKLAKECYIAEVNILGGTPRAWVRLFSLQNHERAQSRTPASPAPIIAFFVACLAAGCTLLAYHRFRIRLRRTHG